MFVVPHTPAALTTSLHTFNNSLYRARDSSLVSSQDSSLHRLAWLALGGRGAWMAVGVEVALVADGSFTRPLGMGAGSAV